jgi:glutamyl-tRNA synthetase
MTDSDRPVVGRLAPSPTGGLHVGHARSFLSAWLLARGAGGRVILRIEDLDAARVRTGSAEGMRADLAWLGLDWDEGPDVGGPRGPYVQSARSDRYRAALDRLKADEHVYPCTCTRAEVARAASAPHEGDDGPVYPGACARRSSADADALGGRPFAWRFRVAADAVAAWDDLVLGPTRRKGAACGGDFIVGRSSGEFAYQLAVVVDDALMGVTQVVRGDDLVPSTPRQLFLYQALGYDPPRFGHVPLVYGADGRRLAKRDGSIKLSTLREQGADPRRLVAWLAESLGVEGVGEAEAPRGLVGRFDLARVPRGPVSIVDGDLRRMIP